MTRAQCFEHGLPLPKVRKESLPRPLSWLEMGGIMILLPLAVASLAMWSERREGSSA